MLLDWSVVDAMVDAQDHIVLNFFSHRLLLYVELPWSLFLPPHNSLNSILSAG